MNIRTYRKKGNTTDTTYYIRGIDDKGGIELELYNDSTNAPSKWHCPDLVNFNRLFEFAFWSGR